MVAEHVHFIDHEDFESTRDRLVNRLLNETLYLFNATVGGGVQFRVVDKTTHIDGDAVFTNATRLGRDAFLTIERLRQNSRDGGLANTPGAGEKIRMVQSLLCQGVGQGLDHVRLPHQLGEGLWAILPGKDKVGHGDILNRQMEKGAHFNDAL